MEAASGGYAEVGRVLLDKGADVNAPPVPSSRDTALTIAADKGHYKFCELLIGRYDVTILFICDPSVISDYYSLWANCTIKKSNVTTTMNYMFYFLNLPLLFSTHSELCYVGLFQCNLEILLFLSCVCTLLKYYNKLSEYPAVIPTFTSPTF